MPVSRQEVMNVVLAQALQQRGLVAAPEQVLNQPLRGVSLPDVIVDFMGLRLVLECEFIQRGSNAQQLALAKARERVESATAHIGVAVAYPNRLKNVAFNRASEELATATLEYSIVTEASIVQPGDQLRLFAHPEEQSFTRGTVDDLAAALRRSYDQLVRDETVDRAVALLESSIEQCLSALGVQPATTDRMAIVLGIQDENLGIRFSARQRVAVNRIAFLIVVNAMIFHEVLSKTDRRVRTLHDIRSSGSLLTTLIEHWEYILNQINYYPIFSSAVDLLKCLSADCEVNRAMEALLDAALRIVEWRASLRHDLAGRIYHRLLEEAKSLGAYYTSIPTASLLLTLALRSDQANAQWSNIEAMHEYRIADLACGTGTLLMAAADAVVDLHIRACVENATSLELDALQRALVEKMIYGFDVLPSAIHLTASTLALRVPDTPIERTHLYRVLHGTEEQLLGSLEFLQSHGAIGTLFSQPEQMGGRGTVVREQINLPTLSVCVMNPPFTSSRKGNRLFGSVPESERRGMQTKLTAR